MKRIFVMTALMAGSHLYAQDSALLMKEVVLTANKIPQKQQATGKVVTVIGKEQLQRNAGRTLPQLLNEQAGVTINGALNNMGTNPTVYMRGASSGRTLILVDGVPVYDPSLINSEFDLNLLSVNAIEKIEIARGAQSTVYGSDAIAGVINIITIDPNQTKALLTKGHLSYGNYGTFRGNAVVTGKSGQFQYQARYARTQSKGFSTARDTTGKAGFDKDGFNSDVAGVQVKWQALPEFFVRGFAQYSRYTTDLDASAFKDEKDYVSRNKSWIAGGNLQYAKNGVRVQALYQFSENHRNYLNDSLDVAGFSKYVNDDYYGRNHFMDVFATIAISSHFTWLQGADYRYSNMNSRYFSLSSFGPYTSTFKDTSMSQASAYASLLYSGLKSRLNVELGGRMNVHSRYGSNHTFTFNPSYAFDDHWRVFGSIATGYKAPTLYQLYSSAGNRALAPEKSRTYEGGVQYQRNVLNTRVVYFQRRIDNGIDYNYNTYKYFNFVKQDVSGLEVEASWSPAKGFTANANYTFMHFSEKTQSRINFKDTTYSYLLRRPAHQLNLELAYRFHNGLYLSASGRYVSSRYDVGGYQKADIAMKSYVILNAYAAYNYQHYTAFVQLQNIANNQFVEVRGFNSIPFLVNAGISFSF